MPVNPAGSSCRCGSTGCWETEIGEEALLARSGRPRDAGRAGVAEIVREAVKVLGGVAERAGVRFEMEEGFVGGAAYDRFGTPLPDPVMELALASDAVLLGAVGGPKWEPLDYSVRPERGLLGLRSGLGLYANLRPVVVFEDLIDASPLKPAVIRGIDLLIVRELLGDAYFGKPRGVRTENGQRIGINTMVYTHIPSSIFLILAAFSPNLMLALALLLVRSALSQMDVPTRTSYVMAVVTPAERTAAASVTAVPRSLASSISPAMTGVLLATPFAGLPLIVCGVLKIVYDVALLYSFRHMKPPEERPD